MKINNSTTVKNSAWQAIEQVQAIDNAKVVNKNQITKEPKNIATISPDKDLIIKDQNKVGTQNLVRDKELKISQINSLSFAKVDINTISLQEID